MARSISSRGLVFGAISVIAVIILSLMPERRDPAVREPSYRQRDLSYWFHELHHGAPEEAGAAFRDMGIDAIAPLIRKVRQNHLSIGQRFYGRFWTRLPDRVSSYCPRPKRHDKQLAGKVAVAVSHIGTKAVPVMILLLDDRDVDVRLTAKDALRLLGEVDQR
jgi:hypothetical protein